MRICEDQGLDARRVGCGVVCGVEGREKGGRDRAEEGGTADWKDGDVGAEDEMEVEAVCGISIN